MMKPVTENIVRILREKKIPFEMSEHAPVYTSKEAADVRGVDIRTGVKALVAKTVDGFIMVLVRADKRADLKHISRLEGGKVSLASPEEVLERTGCEIGAVPPFGFQEMKTYFDREILDNKEVNFNCGEHTRSIRMSAEGLKKVLSNAVFY